MAACQTIVAFCSLMVVVCAAQSAPAPVATDAQLIAGMTAQDFVFPAALLNTPNLSASDSSQRMVGQWPALDKQGISQTTFTLGACALRPPHYHLRATGLLYLISGSIQVGFTSEDGKKAYVNNITAGASTIFPQGLVHYQLNTGCDPATYVISYNSEDPGTQVAVPGLFGLPATVVGAALGLASQPTETTTLISEAPTSKFVAGSDPACVQQCGAAMAPTTPVTTNTAGR